MTAYQEGILILVGINILLALGYWVTVNTGQFSFGHSGFMAIGAYAAAIMTAKLGLPLLPALLVGGLLATVAGVMVGFPALRLSMLYLAMATLGFAELVQILFQNWDFVGGPNGLRVGHGTTLPLVGVLLALALGYLWLLSRSRLGLAYAAVREDEAAARASGLNVTWLKVSAFAQGALLTGVAGGLHAHHFLFIEPANFGVQLSLIIVLYVIFGGMQTFWGPVVGAAVLTLLPEIFDFMRGWYILAYGGLFVVLMIVRPSGLIGRTRGGGLLGALRRRLAGTRADAPSPVKG